VSTIAQKVLKEERLQSDCAEHADAEGHDHERGGGEIWILQQLDLEDRVRVPEAANDERDGANERYHHKADDEVRLQPVFGIAAIEQHLQCADTDREQQRACPIGGYARARRLFEEGGQQQQVDDADRQVDVKHPPPIEMVGDEAADGRTHDRAEQNADAPDGHRLATVCGRESVHHHGLRQGNDAGAERTLQQPEADHLRQRRRLAAEHRRDDEANDADDDHGLPAEAGGQEPAGRNDHRLGNDI
jgi:hypothetical protein